MFVSDIFNNCVVPDGYIECHCVLLLLLLHFIRQSVDSIRCGRVQSDHFRPTEKSTSKKMVSAALTLIKCLPIPPSYLAAFRELTPHFSPQHDHAALKCDISTCADFSGSTSVPAL